MCVWDQFIYFLLFFSQIMSILHFIKNRHGSLHNWPQDILRYLFYIRRPSNRWNSIIFLWQENSTRHCTRIDRRIQQSFIEKYRTLLWKIWNMASDTGIRTYVLLLNYEYWSYGVYKRIWSWSIGNSRRRPKTTLE